MNGFLYVLFTRNVRKTVFNTFGCCYRAEDKEQSVRPSVAALAGCVSLNGPAAAPGPWYQGDEVRRERRDSCTSEIITPVPITQSM